VSDSLRRRAAEFAQSERPTHDERRGIAALARGRYCWLTYRQAQSLGSQVPKGDKGVMRIY
jgi:antirestriction protein ArdC